MIPFFAFPEGVRRIIYTTNAIEALNSKIRRAVRTRGHFPGDDAAMKLLYLVLNHAADEWKRSPRSLQAAMDTSLVVASVLEAHRTACMPPSVGIAAIELLFEASHLAAKSRARIGAAHDMLRDIAQTHNIPVASVPGCPPNEPAKVFAPFVGARRIDRAAFAWSGHFMSAWTVAYIYGFWVLLFASCVASWLLGDMAVRTAAAALAAAMLAGLAAISSVGWSQFETAALIVDVVFMIALTACAIRWPRWWLLGMSAIQILVLAGYLAKALYPEISRLTYAILIGTGPYIQVILLNTGLWSTIRTHPSRTDHHV